jgi:hypothetical protein
MQDTAKSGLAPTLRVSHSDLSPEAAMPKSSVVAAAARSAASKPISDKNSYSYINQIGDLRHEAGAQRLGNLLVTQPIMLFPLN